jgi:AraC-like DNA-binding protein
MQAPSRGVEQVATWPAPPSLRTRVLCVIRRRVPGAEPLSSRVHANAHACLNVIASGRVQSGGIDLPATFVTGPFSQPFETTVQGPLSSVSVVFQPWLLQDLFGIPARSLTDQFADLDRLRASWVGEVAATCRDLAAGDAALPELWRALTQLAMPHTAPSLALDVLSNVGVEAAAQSLDCTARQYRRRFSDCMGLPPATWARINRWERALGAIAASGAAAATLGRLAADAGYSDQAHMNRDIRDFSRRTPGMLRRLMLKGDADWSLQPAHVRNLQDGYGTGS